MPVSKKNVDRIWGLDFLRCVAIVFVMISHGRVLLPNYTWSSYFKLGGFFGVELFFVLSGFLIGGIFIKILEKNNGKILILDLLDFWKQRWFRTLPNYYLFLILNLLVASILNENTKSDFSWEYFFFVQNLFSGIGSFMTESWSLSVEEWFYLVMPFGFFCISIFWSFISRDSFKVNLFLWWLVGIIVVVSFIRFYGSYFDKVTWRNARSIVFYRLDSLCIGVFLSFLLRYKREFISRYKTLLLIIGLVGLGHSVWLFLDENFVYTIYSKTVMFSQVSVTYACLIPYFVELKIRENYFSRMVTHISLISYSLYLVHYSIVIKLLKSTLYPNELVIYGLYWVLSMFLSSLVYKFFEMPMTSLRSKVNFSKVD